MSEYAKPDVLVDTEWVASHLNDPQVRIIESDEDILLYDTGHIPGAAKVDWFTTLQNPLVRDFISQPEFEEMCSRLGLTSNTTLVFYGDKNNWFACYSFWLFEYYGHRSLKIMNGGRLKWTLEKRPLTKTLPQFTRSIYRAKPADSSIRAFRTEVFSHVDAHLPLVDVRSVGEYTGELIHMPGYPQEGAMRGGHIPGAVSIPWSQAVRADDGTFKTAAELSDLYLGYGIRPEQQIIAYCRIGERSSHTWFVLKHLLGYPYVKNYDGSWTEWGNLVGAPIERVINVPQQKEKHA